jgi:LPS sulfotransferase NodH
VTRFVVLTSPRSGSGWLIDLLNSHPAIVAHAELFHVERRTAPDYGTRDLSYFEAFIRPETPSPSRLRRLTTLATVCCKGSPVRAVRQVEYLARLYRGRPGVQAVGFKLTYHQADANPALLPLLSLRRVRPVHLVRANVLAAVISWKIARENGIYHVRWGAPARLDPVLVDAEQLRSELEERELAIARARRRLERLRLPTLELAYEELVARKEETLARVLGFLGLEPQVDLLESALVRARSGSPLELLENPDDVRAALAGTRFEWMLEEAA